MNKIEVTYSKSLKAFNTFQVGGIASKFFEADSEETLLEILNQTESNEKIYVLGGGSNVLITQDIEGLVILNGIKGIKTEIVNENEVIVKVGAGENWHQLVLWCVEQGYGGIENLSLIPGTVGAAPIQNIGAYGVELKDVFHELEAIHINTREKLVFKKEDCAFGYRNSIFKQALKGKVFITQVSLRLRKVFHQLNISYGAIQTTLKDLGIYDPKILDISQAVMKIRSEKLPNPDDIGNAGSFFKNPEINQSQFDHLKIEFPKIIGYPLGNGKVKVPAGWLIQECGWKGYREGSVGCYDKQALVIVNFGTATGTEILNFSERVRQSVQDKFKIELEREVNVW